MSWRRSATTSSCPGCGSASRRHSRPSSPDPAIPPLPADMLPATAVHERLARLTRAVIEEAAARGNAVILGRGGAFIIGRRPDAVHVQLHAPLEARLRYLVTRVEEIPLDTRPDEASLRDLCKTMDGRRADYIRRMFGVDWLDAELYDLSIDTGSVGVQATIDIIELAVRRRTTPVPRPPMPPRAPAPPHRPNHARCHDRQRRLPPLAAPARGSARLPPPQLPALLQRPVRVAHRHLDAAGGAGLAGAAADQRPAGAGLRVGRPVPAGDDPGALRRHRRRRHAQAHRAAHHPVQPGRAGAGAGPAGAHRPCAGLAGHRAGGPAGHRECLRHAHPAVVRGGDGRPRRRRQRGRAQQRGLQRSAHRRPGHRRSAHRLHRPGALLPAQRGELPGRHRGAADDAHR